MYSYLIFRHFLLDFPNSQAMLQPFPEVSGTLILPFAKVHGLPCISYPCVRKALRPLRGGVDHSLSVPAETPAGAYSFSAKERKQGKVASAMAVSLLAPPGGQN